eukprot:11164012-Lingulodinium_polyedra.AAC.1
MSRGSPWAPAKRPCTKSAQVGEAEHRHCSNCPVSARRRLNGPSLARSVLSMPEASKSAAKQLSSCLPD